jgi:hypothetical protein
MQEGEDKKIYCVVKKLNRNGRKVKILGGKERGKE